MLSEPTKASLPSLPAAPAAPTAPSTPSLRGYFINAENSCNNIYIILYKWYSATYFMKL